MQIYERRFQRSMGPEDRLDIWFVRRGAAVVDFAVNHRAVCNGVAREVIRYDTRHGQALHVHRFWRRPSHRITRLEVVRTSQYNDALTNAIADIEAHWRRYRRLVCRGGTP